MQDYIEQAQVTKSEKFYGDRVAWDLMKHVLENSINDIKRLDRIKKSLFYGKGRTDHIDESFGDCSDLPPTVAFNYGEGADIIHAIIGIATEAGELLEAFYAAAYEGKSFDRVNIEEEAGDIFWYMAILAKACDFTFESCQAKNIAKLRERFADKFTEFEAKNRNLAAERVILESNFKKV